MAAESPEEKAWFTIHHKRSDGSAGDDQIKSNNPVRKFLHFSVK